MKKIEDYLHLYLGAPFQLTERYTDGMISFEVGKRLTLEAQVLMQVDRGWMKGKLVLRPLSDMAKDEARECGQFYCKRPIPEEALVTIKLREDYVHVLVKCGSSYLSVFPGGPLGDKADVTRYLISRGFDLFGLIKANLVVDKTKCTL